ncbi:MAG: glycosyltransferase family A protein [Candidatus Dependentiae bacterium]
MFFLLCLFLSVHVCQSMSQEQWHAIKQHEIDGQKELAIVVPTYNNSRWCLKNVQTILDQKYENYHLYIINDCSTDDTHERLCNYLSNHSLNEKVTLIHNEVRMGAMANWYNIIHQLPDHVIVLNIDGDDWLADDLVFARVNNAYADADVWMTFGQFKVWPDGYTGFCKRHDPEVIKDNKYRRSEWVSSHLRTYYAWLFKKIDKKDFMYKDAFLPTTCDRAIMYPLLEMCAGRYYCFEDEALYMYNAKNPLADVRRNLKIQQCMCHYICSMEPYQPLGDVRITL